MVFCSFYTRNFSKSLFAGFLSGLHTLTLLFLISVFCLLTSVAAHAASVTLAWDSNEEMDVAGYRVYYGTTSGHYTTMISVGNKTTCTITNLEPGSTYYFAATAYDHNGNESAFSAEIPYTVPFVDSDADGMPDDGESHGLDPQVSDAAEIPYTVPIVDSDADGMPDDWESRYGLDPHVNDAAEDPDGDGISNIEEYLAGTEPTIYRNNSIPAAPILYLPFNDELVDISPQLVTDEFYDPDVDDFHSESQWQIVREKDEVTVLEKTSNISLTSITIPKLVLDQDTTYVWKVKFIDNHGAASEWSQAGMFLTDVNRQDSDGNGIPDHQEVDSSVDLDEDGIADIDQDDIKCVNVGDGSVQIGVSIRDSETVQSIAAIESENPEDLGEDSDTEGKPESMRFGLLNFKLILDEPGDEAVVTIYLSEPAAHGAIWYKYDPVNQIWQDYSEYTEFSEDRKAVYLKLTDGGFGDADGIENGVIIDPLGLGVSSSPLGVSSSPEPAVSESDSGSSSACFITVANNGLTAKKPLDIWRKMRGIELAMMFLVPLLFLFLKGLDSNPQR